MIFDFEQLLETVKKRLENAKPNDIQGLIKRSDSGCFNASYDLGLYFSPSDQTTFPTSTLKDSQVALYFLELSHRQYVKYCILNDIHEEDHSSKVFSYQLTNIHRQIAYNILELDDNSRGLKAALDHLKRSIDLGSNSSTEAYFLIKFHRNLDESIDSRVDLDILKQAAEQLDPFAIKVLSDLKEIIAKQFSNTVSDKMERFGFRNKTVNIDYHSVIDSLTISAANEIENSCFAEALAKNLWKSSAIAAHLCLTILIPYGDANSLNLACEIAETSLKSGGDYNHAALYFANEMISNEKYRNTSINIIKTLAENGFEYAYLNYGMILYSKKRYESAIHFMSKGISVLNKNHLQNDPSARINNDPSARINSIIAECYLKISPTRNKNQVFKFLGLSFEQGYITAGLNLSKFYAALENYKESIAWLSKVDLALTKYNKADNPLDRKPLLEASLNKFKTRLAKKLSLEDLSSLYKNEKSKLHIVKSSEDSKKDIFH